MSFYDVLRRFSLLSGLEGKDLSRFSQLCNEAIEDMRGRLKVKEENLTDSQKLRLSYTAGALAFYKYCLYSAVSEPDSFSAGEVTVNMNDKRVDAAKKLFDEEYRSLSKILQDTGFYFGRVRA
ncbi:MAG: hypothetical protein IJZ54_02940 [Clostridia bacterium]|nr:hypothetical protein [Clostridia bacterium]